MKMSIILAVVLSAGAITAQRQMRKHTANEAKPIHLAKAAEKPPVKSESAFDVYGGNRIITANGIPNHDTGAFPNRGNPHEIKTQNYVFKLPAEPEASDEVHSLHRSNEQQNSGPPNIPFGIGLNGVVFDPGTAEFWNGDRSSGWNYEALGGAVELGIDENHAHVQPTGAYHYHGMPTGLLAGLEFSPAKHSPLIGWAADGYPVYALYGFDGKDSSKVIKHTSSYRLKKGSRPEFPEGPGGKYDGAFIQDYEFIEGLGTLDECNGQFTVTPEFPNGTYAYFLTEDWPVIPRVFCGTPVSLRASRNHAGSRPLR